MQPLLGHIHIYILYILYSGRAIFRPFGANIINIALKPSQYFNNIKTTYYFVHLHFKAKHVKFPQTNVFLLKKLYMILLIKI